MGNVSKVERNMSVMLGDKLAGSKAIKVTLQNGEELILRQYNKKM